MSTSAERPRALVLDDEPSSREALVELVEREGFAVEGVATLAEGRERLARSVPQLALIDLVLPDGSGMEILHDLREEEGVEIVMITGQASVDSAVEALRLGARDYIVKPIDVVRLRTVLRNVACLNDLRREVSELRHTLIELGRFGSLIGACPSMQEVYRRISKAGPRDVPVLVVGESGTGKEEVARALHESSPRRDQPYVAINCGAITPSLIESELFGHERGAFTGANRRHQGLFEQARGGTLFLDEISEMPLDLQVKLLRVLETKRVRPVGSEASVEVNPRVIAATNRDPQSAVREGRLREDLYYRLNVFRIDVPPLRDRGDDVDLLADHFLDLCNRKDDLHKILTPAARGRLRRYSWPGNVRELRNLVEHAFILAEDEIGPEHFPDVGVNGNGPSKQLTIELGASLEDVARDLLLATLDHCDGNKREAAKVLGISLKTLYNRLNRYRGDSADEVTA